MWTHFNFESGCNPYIAKTEAETARVVRRFRGFGYDVQYLGNGFYFVDDVRRDNWTFAPGEEEQTA